jgi:hypothetical protein
MDLPASLNRALKTALVIFVLALALPAVASTPESRGKEEIAATKAVAPTAKIECKKNDMGETSCVADGYSMRIRGCGDGAFYGVISAEGGVDLNQAIDGHGKVTAHLKNGQFVCSSVSSSDENDHWKEFVVAVDTTTVPDCKGNDLCKNADFPIEWKAPKPTTACDPNVPPSQGYANCAAGWIDNSDLNGYSMGLKDE